jgi:molecular chaperone DnaK (HSP70)
MKQSIYLVIESGTMRPYPMDDPALYTDFKSAAEAAKIVSNENSNTEIVVYELIPKIRLFDNELQFESEILPSEVIDFD